MRRVLMLCAVLAGCGDDGEPMMIGTPDAAPYETGGLCVRETKIVCWMPGGMCLNIPCLRCSPCLNTDTGPHLIYDECPGPNWGDPVIFNGTPPASICYGVFPK